MQSLTRSKKNLPNVWKTKLEYAVVGIGMSVGFSAVMMKLTDIWPCDILEMFNYTLSSFC